jgi:hypothetical protein
VLGEADLKGAVKDRKINFKFPIETQCTNLVVSYADTIETKDSMKGDRHRRRRERDVHREAATP